MASLLASPVVRLLESLDVHKRVRDEPEKRSGDDGRLIFGAAGTSERRPRGAPGASERHPPYSALTLERLGRSAQSAATAPQPQIRMRRSAPAAPEQRPHSRAVRTAPDQGGAVS